MKCQSDKIKWFEKNIFCLKKAGKNIYWNKYNVCKNCYDRLKYQSKQIKNGRGDNNNNNRGINKT